MDNYWELELWNGDKVRVKPQNAGKVQDLITSAQGFLKTPDMTINVKDIKSFNRTDQIYTDQKLIEDVAVAFDTPILTDEGAVEVKWVKKAVPKRRWDNYYRMGEYKLLEDLDPNTVVIAFRVPTHMIDSQKMSVIPDGELVSRHLV